MDVYQLVSWAFQALAVGTFAYGVKEMGKLRESIEKLNITVAQTIVRMDAHDRRADRHEEKLEKYDERIREIETRGKSNG